MFTRKTDQRPTGFTLIELLMAIAILTVLSTMTLALMKSATDDAKGAATNSRIARIEALLQTELENYEVRRLPVRNSELLSIVSGTNRRGKVKNLRRRILLDIINAEMPRPVLGTPAVLNGQINFETNPDLGVFPTAEPAIGSVAPYDEGFNKWLEDNYLSLRNALRARPPAGAQSWIRHRNVEFKLPAEYLYEILSRIDVDGISGVEVLGGQAVADSNGNGFPEVVDAWGNPLQFQILQLDLTETSASSDVWAEPALVDWTSMDPSTGVDLDGNGSVSYEERYATGVPTGYVPLNPVIPALIHQIRFRITSTSDFLAK